VARNQRLRDVVLADDDWVDLIALRPLLIGENVLIKVKGQPHVQIVAANSARPPVLGHHDRYGPGEGAVCHGTSIWVRGKGAHLEISRVNLA